jgi:hypothetical protein
MKIDKKITIKYILLLIIFIEIFTPGSGLYKLDNIALIILVPITLLGLISKLNNIKIGLIILFIYLLVYLLLSFVSTNDLNISVFDSYIRAIIGFYMGYVLFKLNYSKEEFYNFIVYWLQLPIFIIGLLYLYEPMLFKNFYELYTGSKSEQWRFGNLFDLPYMAATFYSICLFFTFELFRQTKNQFNRWILLILLFSNIFYGMLTISKTYFIALLIIIVYVFFRSNHKLLLSTLVFSFLILLIFSMDEQYQNIFFIFNDQNPLEIVISRYSSGGQIENINFQGLYFGAFLEKNEFASDSFYIDLFYNFGIVGLMIFLVISVYLIIKLNFTMKIFFIMMAIESLGSNAFVQNKMTFLIWATLSIMYFYSINSTRKHKYQIIKRNQF